MKTGIPIIVIMFISMLFLSSTNLSAQIPQWEQQLKTDANNTEFAVKARQSLSQRGW